MLELTGIHASYGLSRVLYDVTLKVERGESVVILGRNGVGKTTLMKTVVGTVAASQGTITVDGADLTRRAAHERPSFGIGYIAQGKGVFDTLSVRDNVAAAAPVRSRKEAHRLADEILEAEFPALTPKAKDRAGSLSGGQQRLLALARVLVRRPSTLLLDEPTEGVQPSLVEDLLHKLQDLKERQGLAILLVEQRLEFAAVLADRGHLMVKGRIVRDVDPNHLLTDVDLQHEYLGV